MADNSFPKALRLLSGKDYKPVFDRSEYKASCRYLLILACHNEHSTSRLGLVVAKKNVAKAVQRNRLKRLIRDWFRTHSRFGANLDLVVLVRKDADTLSNPQFRERFAQLLANLNRQCNPGEANRSSRP